MGHSAIELDLHPGVSLGILTLGESLWSTLEALRHLRTQFPQVSVSYDPAAPSTSPVLVHLRPYIDLLFSPTQQRLHTISLRRLRSDPPLVLRYKSVILSSEDQVLRRSGVSRNFGPTYPGELMQYPGVWFGFEEDGQTGVVVKSPTDDRMQEVKRAVVCQKVEDGERSKDRLDDIQYCEVMNGQISRVVARLHEGVSIYFYGSPSSTPPLKILLGKTTAQDLTLDLGPPLRTHYKEDDRMNIHSGRVEEDEHDDGYFFNYFQHGMDFLISGSTHIVQKIILHTNIPGSPLFQRYNRCPWEIQAVPEDEDDVSPPSITFQSKIDAIETFLSPSSSIPSMLLDRGDDDNLALPSSTSRLMGFDGLVLEVLEVGQVVCVMLF
ncbi:hypothetical protein SISNIDRAFT_436865 [Sistotremastrum niveocremeum HHB9708]|uniref:Uncharacterized protein n=2 Tax=Sistotremastraceae TaxID=3402574 RepID=A0A164ZTE9_9AGAM|nr:hypothetical protein SISNIDRAFT_436865 [Sistotremastrum niveocremeum HHB9708]KZT38345.1 hypothetical protein SISSUDRAFT_1021604 [Sistotremastrum suecicum HHB10207 ss-3]